jgi:hypothetical protein
MSKKWNEFKTNAMYVIFRIINWILWVAIILAIIFSCVGDRGR